MRIDVTAGVGSGPTELAAFDSALLDAGVANFNLIRLSSAIPSGAEVVVGDGPVQPAGEWGDRLYVVMAQELVSTPNTEGWAGLGWVQDERTGSGLFVEHHASDRAEVERDIADSLTSSCSSRGLAFGQHQTRLAGVTCRESAVCALVVATFGSEGWAINPV
jgi:arginine decarboxylase